MEAAARFSSRSLFQTPSCGRGTRPSQKTATCWCLFSNGFTSQQMMQQQLLWCGKDGGRGSLMITGAKKKRGSSKSDRHSFVPKPDETTGTFPEAVLLKKEVVQEDGKVLPEFADAEEEKLFEFLSLQLESDLDVERMRHYEVVYLIHEDHVDQVENVISKVQDFVREKSGRIWRLNNWGLRRLAYKIKKARNANYVLMNFELEAKCINDFKTMLEKDDRIIRHLVIKRDEAITEDCPPPREFHTLLADGMDDDDSEDEDGVDEDWNDELELEMAGNDDGDGKDLGDNVIIVDDYEGDEASGSYKGARTLTTK